MSWFFASSSTFQNGNDETVNNRPINLDIVNTYTTTTHLPEGTTEVLNAIAFDVANSATTLYLCYPDLTARDDDFALLEIQAALPPSNKAGYHTSASFVNGSGQTISNKNFNLDAMASYQKTTKKPIGTSENLYSIALVYNNKNNPEYLYYEDEATRDADFVVLEGKVSAVGVSSITALYESITGSSAGAWVERDLGVGAYKKVQVRFATGAGVIAIAGVRAVGSVLAPTNLQYMSAFMELETNAEGKIEIYSNNAGVGFHLTAIYTS